MTLCWTVTRPIIAAVQRVGRHAPRHRVFHTIGHAERIARHHTWATIKIATTITTIVCVGGPLAPYLIPSTPVAASPGAPGGDVDSGPDTGVPFGGGPDFAPSDFLPIGNGVTQFVAPGGGPSLSGSEFASGGGSSPGGGGSPSGPPVTTERPHTPPVISIVEPSGATVLILAIVGLMVVRRRRG
jgi:hypothetical protein